MADRKFKDTEVGRIPVDWEVKRLGELGVTYSGLSGKKKEDFNNGNSYYITFLNVLNNPVIDLKQVEKVRVSKWENQNLVRKGDIFFNTSSETPEEVGMCSVLMEDKPNLYLNSFCFGYRLYDGSKCNALYLTSYLRSDLGRKMFSTIAQGSTRYNLSKKEFNNIAIPLPPLPEQKAIAKVLSDIDELIESIEKLIHKKKQIKQGAMQELLTGKNRLAGFSSEWEVKRLGEVVEYIKGYPFKSKDYCSEGIRIIRVSDTTYDSIKEENQIYINEQKAKKFSKWLLKENDLIISTVGSKPPMYDSLVGKCTIVYKKHEGSLLNQNAVLVRAKNKNVSTQKILYYNLKTNRYINHIKSIFRGNANQASINLDDVFKFPIPLPSLPEQKAIAQILSDMDAEIEALEKKLDKYKKIKEGMMEKLLTGQVRLV